MLILALLPLALAEPALLAGFVPFLRCRGEFTCNLQSQVDWPFVTTNYTAFDLRLPSEGPFESDAYSPVLRIADNLYHPVGALSGTCPTGFDFKFSSAGPISYPFDLSDGCSPPPNLNFVRIPFSASYNTITPKSFFSNFDYHISDTPIFHPIYSNYTEGVVPFPVNPTPLIDEIYSPDWGIQYTPYSVNFKDAYDPNAFNFFKP